MDTFPDGSFKLDPETAKEPGLRQNGEVPVDPVPTPAVDPATVPGTDA